MKIRNGFVSNSSSSSFSIYGTGLDISDEQREEIEGKLDSPEYQHSLIEIFYLPDYGMYVGRPWHTIRDDETGKQFKDATKALIEQLVGEETRCGHIEEASFDG